jgi:cell division protein FtsL
MWRALNVLLLGSVLAGAIYVYHLKHEAEVVAAQAHALSRKIAQERQATRELHAEFSVLTQPGRIQDLAEKFQAYIELNPLDPGQIGSIDDIPMRPPPADPAEIEREAALGGADAKPVVTGSVARKSSEPARKVGEKPAAPLPRSLEPRADDPLLKLLR